MTESDARKRWCPMVRLAYDTVSANRFVNDPRSGMTTPDADCCCIASSCMMWKWVQTPEQAAFVNAQANAGQVENGHCGLTK